MNNLCDLFYQISITGSTKEKKKLLKDFENQSQLQTILKIIYDPDILFRITSKVINEKLPFSSHGQTDDISIPYLTRIIENVGTINKLKVVADIKTEITGRAFSWLLKCIDKDLGIGIKKKLINDVFHGLVKDFPVMLAARRDREAFNRTFGNLAWVYVNLKIDGIRCVVDNTGNSPLFYTREGHQIPEFLTENIKPEFSNFPKLTFDGEIYCDNFQRLMTVFRRETIDAESIAVRNSCKFAMFDVIDYQLELIKRVELMRSIPETNFIKKVKYVEVENDYDLICRLAKKYIERGDEGIIIKHPHSKYEAKRSNVWMKFKNKETEDCKILSYFEGEGKYTELLGGFVVSFKGKDLGVGTGFTDQERAAYWLARDQLVGKWMEISFMEKTKDDLARHPVFERMRLDKENPNNGEVS